MGIKICSKCNKEYPPTPEYFHRSKQYADGLIKICKPCIAKRNRERYEAKREYIIKQQQEYRAKNKDKIADYLEQNKERIASRKKQYYEANREVFAERKRQYNQENKTQIYEYNRQYRKDNSEYVAEYQREYRRSYYPKNKKRIARYKKIWVSENRDKKRVYAQRRLARKRGLPDTFTLEEWEYCLEYFNYTCPVCDSQLRDLFGNVEPHADHWIPLSHEGCPGTIATNMICLCNSCNLSKNNKLPEDWLTDIYNAKKVGVILEKINEYFVAVAKNYWQQDKSE